MDDPVEEAERINAWFDTELARVRRREEPKSPTTSLEEKIEYLAAIATEHIKAKAEAERELVIYKRCLEYILQQTEWRDQTLAIASARQILRDMK